MKLELIQKLVDSGLSLEYFLLQGLKNIESTAFVSPKWVPQMADHMSLCEGLKSINTRGRAIAFPALCPNIKGLESCLKAGVKEIAVFGAASGSLPRVLHLISVESFSKKNINCTISESLDRFQKVVDLAVENKIKVRGYVSTIIGCPYEGKVDPEKVALVSKALFDMGCYEISLGDTIGVGRPNEFKNVINIVSNHVPIEKVIVAFPIFDLVDI